MPRVVSSVTATLNASDPTKVDLAIDYSGTMTSSSSQCGPSYMYVTVSTPEGNFIVSTTGNGATSYTTVPIPQGTHTFTVTSEENWGIWNSNDQSCETYNGSLTSVTSNSITITAFDTTPDTFSFISILNQERNVYVQSNNIIVNGINAPTSISITGGEYSKNNGAWTSAPSTIDLLDNVKVRVYTPTTFNTPTTATLTIGGVSGSFTATTFDSGTSIGVAYLQNSGQISMKDLWDVFGGSYQLFAGGSRTPLNIGLNQYYRGGFNVANDAYTPNVPFSGLISLANFYGQGGEQFAINNLSQIAEGFNPSTFPGASASCQINPRIIPTKGNALEYYWSYTVNTITGGTISSNFPWNTWTGREIANLIFTGINTNASGTFTVLVRHPRISGTTTFNGTWYMEVSNNA